jgi:hypothetical protein
MVISKKHPSCKTVTKTFTSRNKAKKKKVKLSRYMPWRHMGGEEV